MRKQTFLFFISLLVGIAGMAQVNTTKVDSTSTIVVPVGTMMEMEGQALESEVSEMDPFIQQIIPPSPTAASLGQYGDIPVSNYTGVPSISIPLYTVQSGDIQIPITLDYHASGIKVAQEASWVGLGWALNAGGVITRSVRGLDDLKPYDGYLKMPEMPSVGNLPYYENQSDFYNKLDIYNGINNGRLDGQPDMFYYNFLGQSGKLVFERNSGPDVKGIPLSQTSITFSYNIPGKVWTVCDEKGWKYYFGTLENTGNYSFSGQNTFRYSRLDTVEYSYIPTYQISGWYLDSIVTPYDDKIEFQYDNFERKTIGQINYQQGEYQNYLDLYFPNLTGGAWYGTLADQRYYYVSASMLEVDDVYLKKIVFMNGFIEFETSDKADMRQELYASNHNFPKPQKLDKVKVFDLEGVPFKQISFGYSYFNEQLNSYNKENYWRLKLNSIQESYYDESNNTYSSIPPYTFTYNPIQLPAKNSANIDYWGYYNGHDNDHVPFYANRISEVWNNLATGTSLLIQDETDSNTTKYFMPHAVFKDPDELKLPNEGWNKFMYGAYREPNDSTMPASTLQRIDYPTGGATKFEFEPNDYNINYDFDYAGDNVVDHYKEVTVEQDYSSEGSTSKEFSLTQYSRLNITCEAEYWNTNYIEAYNNFLAVIEKSTGDDIVSFKPSNINSSFTARIEIFLPPGNYRILTDNNGDEDLQIRLKVNYIDRLYNEENKIGGGLRIARIETMDGSGNVIKSKKFIYAHNNSSTGIAMTPIDQIYHLQKDVESCMSLLMGGTGINENTIVRTSDNEMPLGSSAQGNFVGYGLVKVYDVDNNENTLGRSEYRYKNIGEEKPSCYVPGVPFKVNSSNGQLIKEEYYNISGDLVKSKVISYLQHEQEPIVTKGIVTPLSIFRDPGAPGYLGFSYYTRFYNVVSEWWTREKEIETIYDLNGGNGITTTTHFEFNNDAHKQLTKITLEGINEPIQERKFYYPHDYGSVFNNLTDKNIIGKPIDTRTYVGNRLTSGIQTKYNNFGQPIETYNFESTANDIAFNATTPFTFTQKQTISYNVDKNPEKLDIVDNLKTYYLWAYNKQYPVAKIESSYIDIDVVSIQNSINNLSLSGSDNKSQIDSDISNIKNAISSSVITANFVTIYTYKPLVGMTSQTDPAGRTTYYEYDDFGRLKLVRDQNGNIVSNNEYHYAGQ